MRADHASPARAPGRPDEARGTARDGPRAGAATRWGVAAGVALAAAIAYAGTLRNGFVYDDVPQVIQNPWIRDAGSLGTLLTTGSWGYAGTTSNYFRPVMHVVYMTAYAVFGMSGPGFHLVNVLLHAAVSLLVFLTTDALLRCGGAPASRSLAVAAVAALLFAVHPIHTEAVDWVGGVPDLCAALFVLAALHLHGGVTSDRLPSRSPRYVLALACFLLAALSKEIALVFPALLAVQDVALRPEPATVRRRLAAWLPYAAVAALYLALRWNALGAFAPVRRHAELAPWQVVLNAAWLFASYLGKLLVPIDLTVFHAFRPVTSATDPRAIAGLLVALAFAAAGALAWRRSRRAFLASCLLLLPLIPALYVPALGENPFAERYLYLPSAGLAWLLALGADGIVAARPRLAPALAVAAGVLALVSGVRVVARHAVWESDLTLWEDAAAKAGAAAIPHYNLAIALQQAGRVDDAIPEYRAALEREPSAVAWTSLAAAYKVLGRIGDAAAALERALAVDPRYAPAHNDLGAIYLDLGQFRAALEPLQAAVSLQPGFAGARYNLGLAYEALGMPEAAVQSFAAALQADPMNARATEHLRRLLARPAPAPPVR